MGDPIDDLRVEADAIDNLDDAKAMINDLINMVRAANYMLSIRNTD